MPRGGRRPGAGAPANNLNALKDGRHSQQLSQALYAARSQEWESFIARLDDRRRCRAYRACWRKVEFYG